MIFFLRAKARATQKLRAILRRRCNVCGWNSNACKAASSARLETSRALNKRVHAECPTYAERSSSEEILVKNWGLVTPRPLVFTTATSSLERRCFRRLNAQIPKRGHGGKRRVPKDNPKNHPHMSSGSNVISPCAQSKKLQPRYASLPKIAAIPHGPSLQQVRHIQGQSHPISFINQRFGMQYILNTHALAKLRLKLF